MSLLTSPAMSGEQAGLVKMINSYSVVELIGVVDNLKKSSGFLLDRCFPNVVESNAPQVALDIDVGKRRMSPFISPIVEGQPVESRRFETGLYTPPTVKDFRNPDFLKPVRRQIGERIGGDVSLRARLEENLVWEIADQKDMIDRRCEWMAAQALTTGKINISGPGYGDTEIDFGRDPSLTVALTGAAQWGQPGVSPADFVTNCATHVLQKSGAMPEDVIFSLSPWQKFLADQKVINNIFQRALIDPRSEPVETGGVVTNKGGIFMGRWGRFRLWLYEDWYVDYERDSSGNVVTDASGNPIEIERPMLPDGSIIVTGPDLQGTRAYGLVQDPFFNYQPLRYAPKLWYSKNPGQINLLMQSAPLMIPSRVNAAMCANVCAPGGGVVGGSN